jgi:hypothetical protein
MRWTIPIIIAALLLLRVSVAAGSPTFSYDKELAIDLAEAYIRWELRIERRPEVGEINFRQPFIHSATDRAGRNFVFVAFPSSSSSWGAYATFQVCQFTPLLIPNEASTVNTFKAYWDSTKAINPEVFVAIPDACPKDED